MAVRLGVCALTGFPRSAAVLAVGGGSYPSLDDATVFIMMAFFAAMLVFIFRDRLLHRSPQARLDARLGLRHSCGDGGKGVWQYLGPQETLTSWGGVVWRRFRVCSACGECEHWPVTTIDPGDNRTWHKWRPILFDDMLTRIKIREEHLASMKNQEDTKKRVMDEKHAQHKKELAEAAAKQQESNEKAREFINAKIHLLNEKPDPPET